MKLQAPGGGYRTTQTAPLAYHVCKVLRPLCTRWVSTPRLTLRGGLSRHLLPIPGSEELSRADGPGVSESRSLSQTGSPRSLQGRRENKYRGCGAVGQAGGGGMNSACVLVLGSRESLSLDAKTEDGTNCLFNKSLLFIQKSTIGFIPQILKKWVEGKASHHGALKLINLLSPGGGGLRDLEEGHLGDTLPRRRAGAQARARSEPPPSTPPPAAPSKRLFGLWGPPRAFAAPRHEGARPCPPGSPDGGEAAPGTGFWVPGAQRGFLQGEAASPGVGGGPPSSPRRKGRFPKAQWACRLGSWLPNRKAFQGKGGHKRLP